MFHLDEKDRCLRNMLANYDVNYNLQFLVTRSLMLQSLLCIRYAVYLRYVGVFPHPCLVPSWIELHPSLLRLSSINEHSIATAGEWKEFRRQTDRLLRAIISLPLQLIPTTTITMMTTIYRAYPEYIQWLEINESA